MLLKDLAKRKEELQREQERKQAMAAKPPAQVASRAAPVRTSIDQRLQAQRLTALVKQQLAPCWSIPGGVKDAYSVKVAVEIRLNTNGTLRGPPRVLDTNRMRTDRSFRAVAESAVRALHKCSPLKLPYDQYNLWQNITFNFDPSEALGQ
jgi:colicin import membrane protein